MTWTDSPWTVNGPRTGYLGSHDLALVVLRITILHQLYPKKPKVLSGIDAISNYIYIHTNIGHSSCNGISTSLLTIAQYTPLEQDKFTPIQALLSYSFMSINTFSIK